MLLTHGIWCELQVIYTVVVYVLLRPSPDYLNSYRYLSAREDSCVGKLINIFGPK